MAEQELKNLFAKYLDDSISPEEFSRLYELVKTEYNASELDELFRSAFADKDFAQRGNDYDPKAVFAEVLSKIEKKEKAENTSAVIPIRRRNSWIKWVAAASIIFLMGGAYFLFFNKTKPAIAQTQEERYKNDVAPGSNKAVLTLGNGKKIILDSAANGELAKEGNAKIMKTDSGKLAYNITDKKPTEVFYNVLTTPKGGQHHLILADGSEVWLNAASSIRFPTAFTGKERKVEITGEAYFKIAHDDKQPFKVKANNEIIEDIGTEFNVNAYADEPVLKTTLIEGSVKVNDNILKPGQQAQFINDKIIIVSDVDIDGAIAWKNGLFKMDNVDITAIMRQIGRWYDVEVVYDGKVQKTFGGSIPRNMTAAHLLQALELTGGVHFAIDNKKITVMP